MPTTVTGTIQNISGGAVSSGTVTFTLVNYGGSVPYVNGTALLVAPLQVSATTDVSGNFSISVYSNDSITPSTTFYQVNWANSSGVTIGSAGYLITGSSPVNLNSLAPISSVPVAIPPIADTIYARLDASNGPFTNPITTPGLTINASSFSFNGKPFNAPSVANTLAFYDGTSVSWQTKAWIDARDASGVDIFAKVSNSITADNQTIIIAPGSYTATTTLNINFNNITIIGYGASVLFSGTDDAISVNTVQNCTIQGLKILASGVAGSRTGIHINTASHFWRLFDVTVAANVEDGNNQFFDGLKVETSYYGAAYSTDISGMNNAGFHITNGANANKLIAISARGANGATKYQKYGVLVDDAGQNSDSNKVDCTACEGNVIANVEIEGADYTEVSGHIEASGPSNLTGTLTITNGSPDVTGSGTFFTTELLAGQVIKATADAGEYFQRICTINSDTSLTLCHNYYGTGGSGVVGVKSQIDIYVGVVSKTYSGENCSSGQTNCAISTMILNTSLGGASGVPMGLYLDQGSINTQAVFGDIREPLYIDTNSNGNIVQTGANSGLKLNLNTTSFVQVGQTCNRIVIYPNFTSGQAALGINLPSGWISTQFIDVRDSSSNVLLQVYPDIMYIPAASSGASKLSAVPQGNGNIQVSGSLGTVFFTDNMTLGNDSNLWPGVFSTTYKATGQITSTLSTGTSPFSISSTTVNANLNADLIDGLHAFKLTASLSPSSVSATTCAEQTFTVTGVAAGDVVFVNKPTAQAGLAIAGVRSSGTNQVGINFCNETASPITPTASETYTFGVLR